MADRRIPDSNGNFSLAAVSNDGTNTPVVLWADPTTHALVPSGNNSKPTTGTITTVSATTSNISILASNSNRLGATIYNESGAIAYIKLGTTASVTSYTLQIAIAGYYEVPISYTGAIDGITSTGTAVLRVTELT